MKKTLQITVFHAVTPDLYACLDAVESCRARALLVTTLANEALQLRQASQTGKARGILPQDHAAEASAPETNRTSQGTSPASREPAGEDGNAAISEEDYALLGERLFEAGILGSVA